MKLTPQQAKEQRERLLLLADFLEAIPRDRIDLRSWRVGVFFLGHNDHKCGTTACALGWATVMPEFQDLGLAFRATEGGFDGAPSVPMPGMKGDTWEQRWYGLDAAMHLFHLDYRRARWLFMPLAYRLSTGTTSHKSRVIKRLRKMAADPDNYL